MGGHLDDAERCQTVPIVSISLGLDAIYLIGGRTKAQEPIPLLLRSGDVILQACQRSVHKLALTGTRTLQHGVRLCALM